MGECPVEKAWVMVMGRNGFFLLLLLVCVVPFYGYKICWLCTSRRATGVGWFVGHTLELNGAVTAHLVVLFQVGGDSVWFNAETRLGNVGERIPVRYQRNDPSDARVDVPLAIWGDTVVNSLLPVGVMLILFLTPNRFDPLIPWGCRVVIGGRPVIKILPRDKGGAKLR